MVVYTCERCQKQFPQKCVYDNHINRKLPCHKNNKIIENDDDYYCKTCDKYFSRSDALKRHENTLAHMQLKEEKVKMKATTTNGNINQINGNNNIIINNNYYLLPFGGPEIDKLTTEDKVAIFTSDENPIIMIIIKTNLNILTPEYHNVGYPNKKSGYGLIFNGKTWEQKEISLILRELLTSKRKDLLNIYEEIKYFLKDEKGTIESKVNDTKYILEPDAKHPHVKPNKVEQNVKVRLNNGRHLHYNAFKTTGSTITSNNETKKSNNSLKMDLQKIDSLLKNKEKNREIALYTLDMLINKIDNDQYQKLKTMISNSNNAYMLSVVIHLLGNLYCFDDEINETIIDNKIEKNEEINEMIVSLQ